MNSTISSSDMLPASLVELKAMHASETVPAEQLRLHALDLLESNVDLTVDFTGMESLDLSTLQVLLALEIEQAEKNLRLCLAGVSPGLLRWFEYAGAQGLLMDPIVERNSPGWN
jgi:anti-anti-sigma regulatory factor